MTRAKKLVLAALTALALAGGAVAASPAAELAKASPKLMRETPAHVAGDPSQWLEAKVNEYEGQHRVAGKDPEFPVTSNLAGKDPEMPVSPNQA